MFFKYPLKLSADIHLQRSGIDKIIARSSARTDEDGVFGKDDDLHTTASMVILERLEAGDKVYYYHPKTRWEYAIIYILFLYRYLCQW